MKTTILRFANRLAAASLLLASAAASAVDSTWIGGASGSWSDPANWSDGVPQAAGDYARINSTATITLPSSITLRTLYMGAPSTVTIASGATLSLSNGGGDVIIATTDAAIDGEGDLTFSMGTGTDYANIKPSSGTTLTIAARIAANGSAGVELNSNGTLLLTNPANSFTGVARISAGNGTLLFSDPGALGVTAARFDGSPSRFAYTGSAAASLTLPVQIQAGSATFENAGGGILTLDGAIAPVTSGTKTLTFAGAAHATVVAGTLANDAGTLNVVAGSGTLVLNGTVANNAVTIDGGATLAVGEAADFQTATLNCNSGAILAFNPSSTDGFAALLPAVSTLGGAGVRFETPAAATASTNTFPSLVHTAGASLDLSAPEIGTVRNTVLIENFAPGSLPAWFTVNGQPAAYDAALGVVQIAATGTVYSLTALGPAVVPDDPDGAAVIDSAGTAGGISLANDPTTIFSLTQDHAENPATVGLDGQLLATRVVAVAAGGNDLTLTNGTLSTPATLSPPVGPFPLPTLTTGPVAWYDLSDDSTVTTNAQGRITLLANKGSLGTTLNAAVPDGHIGPLYLPDAVAGLGVALADAIEPPQSLASLNNPGIIGSAPRTAFIVTRRSRETQNSLYAFFMGTDGISHQAFAFVERENQTSFIAYGNDLNVSPASPPGHNVLTFITGLNDVAAAGAGYRNGVLLGTRTFTNISTADEPIRLLHRPEPWRAASGPGELAEALLFDYTLSESDREAVEAYLMDKWGIAAEREETLLALRNESASSKLTVAAEVADPYAATLNLAKSGPGDVLLSGPLNFNGTTLIQEGTLAIDSPSGPMQVLAGPVSGPGSLIKAGPGSLTVVGTGTYSGGTTVSEGTLLPVQSASLGTGAINVEEGGALDVANAVGGVTLLNPISAAGSGPDGLGALRNSHLLGVEQQNAFRNVTLTGDTDVFTLSRLYARGGLFDFGGNTLTINGGGVFGIVGATVANVPAGTAIHVADGMMNFETTDYQGSAAAIASADSGSGISLYQMTVPIQWSLQLADDAYFRAGNGGTDPDINVWDGPVTLTGGTARLTPIANASAAITGSISGDGALLKENDGWFWLLNPANTYAGATTVTQGTLYAVSAASLGSQEESALTVSASGAFVARAAATASPDGWSHAEIAAIADASVFTTPGTTALGLDTFYDDFTYTGDLPYTGLLKFGPFKLTLTGSAPDLGGVAIHDGELDLTGSGSHTLHTYSALVGATADASALSVLRLSDTELLTDDLGYNVSGPTLTIGDAVGARGVMHVGSNALAYGRLMVGNSSGSVGAVYQSGGAVTNSAGLGNEGAIGVSGYGYYRLDEGLSASKGQTQVGRNSGSAGLVEQRGGTLQINPGNAPGTGVVGDYYNGSFATRAGTGIFLLSGGTFNLNAHSLLLGEWSNVNNYNGGYGVLTIENDAQAETAPIVLANRNGGPQAYVNLNGGSLTATYLQKGGNNASGNNAVAHVNFNGGLLRVPSAGNAVSSLVRTGANNDPATLNSLPGGALIETLDSGNITLDLPLDAPIGLGISSVDLTSPGAGYIAPPVVTFTGGGGFGATAVAELDTLSGTVTAIRVTSPGVGYTSAPAVTLFGGGFTSAASATATLGATASGGLVKLGSGTLSLNAANTYTGPTVVSNGTLRLGAGSLTLAAATPITVAGGTLDLGGTTLTNFQPVVIESGRLVNGTLSALSFTKTGSGEATLTAEAVAPTPAALREAFIKSLNPIIWYDPSDTTPGNLVVDGSSRVSLMRNKGTLGSTHDAVPYSGTGPLLLSGAASPSPLGAGVLQLDNATANMKSLADIPVTGTAPRTLIAVMARDSARAVVGLGSGADGQTFEIGNDPAKTYVSGIGAGRDTQFTSNIPAVNQLTFIASVNGYNGNFVRGVQLWRSTGGNLETLTATWPADMGTASAPISIGRRAASTYRGKVGEVLLFDRILTAGEISALEVALSAKYLNASEGDDSAVPPVSVAEGTLRLAPGADAIAALAPAVWYDPSDAAAVTTNSSGRVTSIANKGVMANMDAVTGTVLSGGTLLSAPLYATGALSYAASRLPMIGIDANNRGLASTSNLGITGTDPRTVVGVFARDNSTTAGPITAFGNNSTAQLFEVGDRHNGTLIGCFGTGNDLIVTPLNHPVQQAHVFTAANSGERGLLLQRSGVAPNNASHTISSTLATGNSRFFIGQRPNTTNRADFRGQIGEILVFDRLLTESERADVESYLVNKWTLPGGADGLFSGTVFDVAQGATLDLGGAREGVTVTGSGTLVNGTLADGFVISPAGDSAVGELTLSGVTIGTGVQYRLTTIGNDSDRLLVDGDLSGMTVVPATDDELTGSTYTIASGSIAAKPALSGFPDKFKLIQRGNDLLLTSIGGTLIILK